MIACTLTEDGKFAITGLTAGQLTEIETAIAEMYNRTTRDIHRGYRSELLELIRPITAILDLDEHRKEIEKVNLKLNL